MTEPTPDVPLFEFTDTDAPLPDHTASEGFVADPPPVTTEGGFRGFAQRSARNGRKARVKADVPIAVKAAIPNKKGQFVEPLMKLYAGAGTAVMMFDPVCGNAVLMSAQKCAESVDELAYQNESVRKAIWALTQTSIMGAVVVAHLPIIMAIVMHHVPAAQQAMGAMGANMMEEFLKQNTEAEGSTE